MLRSEVEARMREGKGPVTPEGDLAEEKYRLVVEGPPNWTSFREFWKMFYDEGAVVVARPTPRSAACTTSASATTRSIRSSRSPTTAWALHQPQLPQRIDMICKYLDEYQADGLLINSIKAATASPPASSSSCASREAHRQAGGVHRVRPRRPPLLLGREHQEPPRELLPDDQAEARCSGSLT